MIKRRDFLKTATISAVAISPINDIAGITPRLPGMEKPVNSIQKNDNPLFSAWETNYDAETETLTLKNGNIYIQGILKFISNDVKWSIHHSRDGIQKRNTLVDKYGNVQGYWVLNPAGRSLELLFYHRTAQNFQGEFSFEGTITFFTDAYACITKPRTGERVLSLINGKADSLLNDSLFSPGKDVLIQFDAADLLIHTVEDGKHRFRMAGRIEHPAENTFTFRLEEHYFQNRYVPYYRPLNHKHLPTIPAGWMSWNTYFDKASAKDNLNEAKLGKKYLLPFGCEFWSIESWQGNSDQLPVRDFYNMDLEVNEKQFPEGMKKLADQIRKLGFRPGLWIAPFGTGNTDFYKKHTNWFLHDKEGKPISSWNGRYTLDPTVKEARQHLKEIFRIASREWGYDFFKIDGMSGRNHSYCAHLYERPEIKARFSDPDCPNPFELCVKTFREGIGEDCIFLACQGHTSGPEALYAEASRIGADIVHPNETVKWNGVMNQARCLINQVFTHHIVMIADPDTLLVGDLPLEEARTSATIVALPGQLTFFGDKLSGLSASQIRILQQTLPVVKVRPGSLYPSFSMLPIWNLHMQNKILGDYNVVAFFNWEDEKKTISVTTRELGIPDTDYTGIEFWTGQTFRYQPENNILSLEVPAHGVRLITLHEVKNTPQWIGSDRHITQNAMELTGYEWIAEQHLLKGEIQLIKDFPLMMKIHVPATYSYAGIICKEAICSIEEKDHTLTIEFRPKKTSSVPFSLQF